MSFSARVKEELSHQLSKARHCQIAELAAILSLCGKIHIDEEDHFSIRIHTENVAVARKYFTLLKNTFNIKADISIRRNAFLKKSRSYTLLVRDHENALRVLEAVKMVDAQGNVGENLSVVRNLVIQNACCKKAFIRGAFLAAGSLSDPEKFYHFEIVCASLESGAASECDSDIRHRCENSCQKEVLCGIYKRRQSDCGTSGADGSACGIDGVGKYPDPERNAKQRQPSGQLRDCQYQ